MPTLASLVNSCPFYMTSELWKKCCQCGLWPTISCRSRETSSKSWAGGFHNDELDTKVVMSLWILIWSSFLLASVWNKTLSLSDVILQMSCTLLLYKTFPDSWFPSHDLLKCHLMVRPSQPSDNQNPVYVLQKWWWGQFKISLLNMWCVCAQVIWGEQKLIICCRKSTCGSSHHPQGRLQCLRSIL
jgi:hypothetical protein